MQEDLIRREMEKRIIEILNSSLLRQTVLYLTMAAVGALLLTNLPYLMNFFS